MIKSPPRASGEIEEIYARHADMVYRICFSFMKNKSDAEDMLQTAFLRLISAEPKFKDGEHEKAWLIKTASNLCRDRLKSKWYKTRSSEEAAEKQSEFAEIDETLQQVLRLPDKYKTAVYMYYYEEYTTEEIAKILKKPASTVRGHLREARILLKEIMERT